MEFIGTVQFFENGRRTNPVALYLDRGESECRVSARLPRWQHIVGSGATVNKAAGNFEINLKSAVPAERAYEGPYWNAGIKAEKPAPPKPTGPAPAPKPTDPAPGGATPSA
jgi:hypothetical protein